jgi:hypothetical protein
LIGDKERGNFCEEFRFMRIEEPPRTSKTASSKKDEEDGADAREKWRRLFKED